MITVRDDPCAALDHTEVADLARLLDRHFAGVDQRQVQHDLRDKSRIVRLFDDGRLVGFSTIAYARLVWRSEDIGVVWSGDTIIDPSAWHAAALPAGWLAAVRREHRDRGRLAWCLICSGLRTWRFMTRCCRRYAPSPEADDDLVDLRDHLARTRYGASYADGIVRLSAPQRLRSHLAEPPAHLTADPATARFAVLNPGHDAGDELACATWLAPDNLTRIGRIAWERSGEKAHSDTAARGGT